MHYNKNEFFLFFFYHFNFGNILADVAANILDPKKMITYDGTYSIEARYIRDKSFSKG